MFKVTFAIICIIMIVTILPTFAKGGHGRGVSMDGFSFALARPGTTYGTAPAPPRTPGGGHSGESPFAIPDFGSPNVKTTPGRVP